MFKDIGKKIKTTGKKVRGFVSRKIHGLFLVALKPGFSLEGFTYVHPNIKERLEKESFSQEIVEVSFKIFRRYKTSQMAIDKMKEKKCRPATFLELLFLVLSPEKIPRRYRRFALASLEPFCEDIFEEKSVVVFTANDHNKDLHLMRFRTEWPKHFRFLAVYEENHSR